MKHANIWTAIDHLRGRGAIRQRGIEDLTARVGNLEAGAESSQGQQARDYQRIADRTGVLAPSLNVHVKKRQEDVTALSVRVEKLVGRLDAQEGIHWDKIKELEDQQQADHKRSAGAIEMLDCAVNLHRRARLKQIDKLCKRVFDLENISARGKPNVPDIEAAQAAHDKSELDRLVDYIRSELPDGTAGMGETIVDTAIRLLKRYRKALEVVRDTLGAASEDKMRQPLTQAYVIARDALDAALKQDDDVV